MIYKCESCDSEVTLNDSFCPSCGDEFINDSIKSTSGGGGGSFPDTRTIARELKGIKLPSAVITKLEKEHEGLWNDAFEEAGNEEDDDPLNFSETNYDEAWGFIVVSDKDPKNNLEKLAEPLVGIVDKIGKKAIKFIDGKKTYWAWTGIAII